MPDDNPTMAKRKKGESQLRKTEHFNLQVHHQNSSSNQTSQLDTLLKVLRERKKIVVIAGAGIPFQLVISLEHVVSDLTSDRAIVPDFRFAISRAKVEVVGVWEWILGRQVVSTSTV